MTIRKRKSDAPPADGPVFVCDAETEAWHAARRTGIGASEAAAACGVSTYLTPLHVYGRKLGELAEVEETDAMRLGKLLEPVVRAEFTHRTGIPVWAAPCGLYRHPRAGFMLATPDAILEPAGTLLECKTTTWRLAKKLGEEGSDYIPEEWVCQAQQQLAVMGADVCHVAALIDGRTLRQYVVARDDELIGNLEAIEAELWERIINRDPPEPTWSHSATPALVKSLYRATSGETVELPLEIADLWGHYQRLGEDVKALEQQRDELKARVAFAMGDAAIARFPGLEIELARSVVPEKEISFVRKPYVNLRSRKVKE
jgi:putative phage-type endonuclease